MLTTVSKLFRRMTFDLLVKPWELVFVRRLTLKATYHKTHALFIGLHLHRTACRQWKILLLTMRLISLPEHGNETQQPKCAVPATLARMLMVSRSVGRQHRRCQDESRPVARLHADEFSNNCRCKPTCRWLTTNLFCVGASTRTPACLPACMRACMRTAVSRYMRGVLTMSELPLFRESPDICRLASWPPGGVLNTSGLLKCNQWIIGTDFAELAAQEIFVGTYM